MIPLSLATSGSLNVAYSYASFSTTASEEDYTITGSAAFADGESTTVLTISAADDATVEGTENLNITLLGFFYTVGMPGSVDIPIYDNDTPQVSVTNLDGNPTEGGSKHFRISRSGGTSGNLSVSFTAAGTATSGTDYTSIGTSTTITSGNSYVDVTVATLPDNLVEGNETVTITITDGGTSYTANNATASMTITDDPPVTSIAATDTVEGENGKFRISRTGGKTSDSLVVYYSVTGGTADSGDDFTALSGSATIDAGNNYTDVTLAALPDNLVEGNETVEVTISSGGSVYTVGGGGVATLTITDDPPIISVARLADGKERSTPINGVFRVTRTGGDLTQSLIATYTMSATPAETWTATEGDDYSSLSGTVTINPGDTYADVVLTVIDDALSEPTETAILTLQTGDNYLLGTKSATLFIWDNDAPLYVWKGSQDTDWMNAGNWLHGEFDGLGNLTVPDPLYLWTVPPGSSSATYFSSAFGLQDSILHGPLVTGYGVAEMHMLTGYPYRVQLQFPLNVGSLEMLGGIVDQPSSSYGSNLIVHGAGLWTGGILNTTLNAATVAFVDSAAVTIDAASGLTTGSRLGFGGSSLATASGGTITFTSVETMEVTSSSAVNLSDLILEAREDANPLKVTGDSDPAYTRPKLYVRNTTAHSLQITKGGGVHIFNKSTVKFTKTIPGLASYSVLVVGGQLNIENGSKLDVGANKIRIVGDDGGYAGNLSTYAFGAANTPNAAEPDAIIKTARLEVGGEGLANVTISDYQLRVDLDESDHRYARLYVDGDVTWEGGTYWPTVHPTAEGTRDRWVSNGVFKVKGTATKVTPGIVNAAVGRKYAVMEADGKFSPVVSGNADLPTIEGMNQNNQNLWKWKQGTAYSTSVWIIERERA